MFVGHLAVALGAKKVEPELPLAAGVAACFGIDLLWPVFLLLGLETVRVAPGDTAFTPLAFESYPWSHSLLMVLVWAGLAGLTARVLLRSTRIAAIVGALVVSHWVLDALTHRPDLPIWPGGPLVGLGLWNSVVGTLVVEGLLFGGAIVAYLSVTEANDKIGTAGLWTLILLAGAIWASQPWAPPAPNAGAVAATALALWVFPPWAHWVERHRAISDRAPKAATVQETP